MSNEASLVISGDESSLEAAIAAATKQVQAMDDSVTTAASRMSEHVDEASNRFDALGEHTDQVASKASMATGAFGALGSGVSLLNAKSEARKQRLAAENEQIGAQISLLQGQVDANGKLPDAIQAQIDALTAKQSANDRESAAIDQHEQKYAGLTNTLAGVAMATDALSGVTDLATLATQSKTIKTIANTAATVGSTAVQGVAKGATMAWTGAQWLLNAALDANPIGLIVVAIGALIAIVVLIATKTHWFQDLWHAAWGGIKSAALGVWHWFEALPGAFITVFTKIGNAITAPFKAAFNWVGDAWNNTVGKIHFTVPSWVPVIGGDSFSVPHIPKFHTGGVMPGLPGSEGLALLQAGERVTPAGATSGARSTVYVDLGAEIMAMIRRKIDQQYGGDVNLALAGV